MFERIKEALTSIDGINNLSREELFYAWKWYEEGCFELNDECHEALVTLMCLSGM